MRLIQQYPPDPATKPTFYACITGCKGEWGFEFDLYTVPQPYMHEALLLCGYECNIVVYSGVGSRAGDMTWVATSKVAEAIQETYGLMYTDPGEAFFSSLPNGLEFDPTLH